MKKNVIIVPTDFSSVAECAVNHAIKIAEYNGAELQLLHLVEEEKAMEDANSKMTKIKETISKTSNIVVSSVIKKGNIFDDIGDTAAEVGARLLVMGTHGAKGMQKLTGSYALKVITNTKAPFIIVQEKPIEEDGYKNIVMPMDLSKATKQKIGYAADIANYFDSKIHILAPNEGDEFLKNQLNRNIAFAKKYFTEHNVSFSTAIAEDSDFVKEVIRYAGKVSADLITIMNLQSGGLINLFGGGFEQQLITNEAQIPVMCINPKETSVAEGKGLFS